MRRFLMTGLLGSGLACLFALSIGTRPMLKARQAPAVVASNAVSGAFGGGKQDADVPRLVKLATPPMTLAQLKIQLKLREKITMAFPNDTPIEDVIKYVQNSTIDKTDFPEGLPVHVNPQGLQDADKTLKSTISIDLKGIPLATSLQLTLDQLGLAFWVHPEGLLIITSKESEEIPVDGNSLILDELSALRQEVKSLRDEVRMSRGVEEVPHPAPANPPLAPGGRKMSRIR